MQDAISKENLRRVSLFNDLVQSNPPNQIVPAAIKERRLHRGQRGIYRDLDMTRHLAGNRAGITVGVLHIGKRYEDDLSQDGVIYHYPVTENENSDKGEVLATKNCGDLGLPLFVISKPSPTSKFREVNMGWVVDFDDQSQQFLIEFSDQPIAYLGRDSNQPTSPFKLKSKRKKGKSKATTRPGQEKFRFDVFKRYGPECVVCEIKRIELLEAVHLCSVEHNGSDDPRNGLVLCRNHHRAFDKGLFGIRPADYSIVTGSNTNSNQLGLKYRSIDQLTNKPHPEALQWAWDKFPK